MNQKCSVNGCTATQLREVDEIKDHSRQTVEAVEPTCTSFGTVAHKKCTLCNALFDTNNKPITAPDPISKREHNMTEHAAVEPSCTKDGTVAYKFCSSCEQNFNMQNQVIQSIVWKALGHNYSSKVTAPTCTEKGYTTHTCTRTGCGFTTTDTETDALGHNYIGVVTAPTCTVDGYTTYTCSNGCGSTYVADTVKAEGHKFNTETGRVEATCTTDGSITKECDNCTETKTETIKSNGHDEILSTITAANCTQSGQERVQCSKCNLDTTRAIAPLGHKMNEATCKLPETCSVCGTTQGTANGHDFIIYNKQEPTCTATGLTAGRNCKNCDEEDMPQEIIPALGHKAPENAPDCQKHKCATCNSEMDNEVQPHTLGAWIIHEATCEDGGYKEKICSKCKQQIEKEITSEKRAHDWGTYSYKEDGSHIRYCQYSDCNASETQDCKMIHKELDPATCTENGVAEHYKCNICNTSYINGKKVAEKDLVIPAGHNPVVKVDAKESSCSQSGNILHWLCKTCEKTYSDEDCTIENPYVNLGFGHKMNHVAAKAATCNETGTKEHYYCEACGFYYEDKDGLKVLGNKEEDVTLPAKCTLKRMEGYSPTCSQTGMLPYYVCTVCGESYADENEAPLAGQDLTIPAKGHTSENMILFQEQTKADNCDDRENTYYAIYKCIHECCEGILYKHEDGSDTWNSIEEAMIAKHNPGNAATCTTDQTCEDCGDVIVEKLNHDGWRKEVAATCTSDGTKAHFNCQRCKAQYKVEKLYDAEGNELSATDIVIPLNGHSWSTEWDRDSKHHWHPCTACGIAKTDEGYIEHSFEEEEITAPTCNTTGEMLYKCECGYSYDETIPATGKHAWIEDGEPTNQNKPCGDGTQNYKCGTCGSEKSEFILGNDKHDPNMTAPTCTEDVVCNLCDEVLEHAPGHNDGGLKPSCQAAVNCMVCNAPMYQIQDHDWSGDAATCVKPQVCVNCPKVLVPATGKHTWELTETKDSTCTAKGSKLFTCTVCGETRVDVIELKDHNYTSVVVTAPTCTNKGYTTHTCECGHTYDDSYVDALGHDISKTGEVTKEADCVTNGVKAYACQRKGCNHSVLEQIANKGGHKNTTVVTAATCETKGYTTHTCTVCGNVEKTNEVKALGHNYSSAVTEPTCTAQGYTTYTCANCGDAYKADYVNAAHEYITETKDPTCTNRGYTAFTCVHCGDSFKDAYQEATGHAWDEGKDQVAPDCMTSGVKVFTCATCKETKTETVPAKGQHSYTTTVVAGGCTTAGYTLNTCTGCGHSYKTNLTAVAGHKPVVIPAKKATCTETGLTAGKKCETCNEILTAQSVTEKLGHVAAKTTITKATKTAAGAIVKTCACGEEVSRVAIAKIASEKLNYSAVVYDGREKGPKLIIKDANGKKLKKNTDYTVKMPGKRVAIGVYTYTITYKGNYSGTSKVTLTIMPKATTISKVSGTKKAVTVKWKKAAKKQTTGYEIMVATNKNFTKGKKTVTVKGYNKTSAKVTKLSAKKTYYARVRTYKTVNGKKVYSKWSTVKTVKTKQYKN